MVTITVGAAVTCWVGESEIVGEGDGEKDSDGSRMKVGEGIALGVAVDWTNGGRVGRAVASPTSIVP